MSWIKGLIWGITGMVVGGALMLLFGQPLWSEPMVAGAYTFFLVGWLLGAGVWDHWARGWFGLENRPTPTQQSAGTARYFAFSTDHKVIGIQYMEKKVRRNWYYRLARRSDLKSAQTRYSTPCGYLHSD
tara:strand:+ start:207 stop:593 length:387 start_codon:yes stop_codon:yes gene_type:complete